MLNDLQIAQQIANRIYEGTNLEIRHASEISGYSSVWEWIQTRIRSQNWNGINVGDFIRFQIGTEWIQAEVAGIDTYYNYGTTTGPATVPHHIDFISKDCYSVTQQWNTVDFNNGIAGTGNNAPWMVSRIRAYLNSLDNNIVDSQTAGQTGSPAGFTTTGLFTRLPQALRDVIIGKGLYIETRYNASSVLADSTGSLWPTHADGIGKLWLPTETEVYGRQVWGSRNSHSDTYGPIQYPIFANNMKRGKMQTDGSNTKAGWWLLSVMSGNTIEACHVGANRQANHSNASNAAMRFPICFRIG